MDWQLVATAGLVGAAVGYLVLATWRTWAGSRADAGCGTGCGKCAAPQAETLADRRRIALPRA